MLLTSPFARILFGGMFARSVALSHILPLLVLAAGLTYGIRADPVEAPTRSELPEVPVLVKMRAAEIAGEAKLKRNPPSWNPMFRSAPRSYAEAEKLPWPEPSDYELLFSSEKAGSYSAPGNTRVYQWERGAWAWERGPEIITRWKNGVIVIEANGHKVARFPNRDFPLHVVWNFPDGSSVSRNPWSQENTVFYIYERVSPDRAAYQMYAPGKWAPLSQTRGHFQFEYSKEWAGYLEAFALWGGDVKFFELMKDLFGFQNPGAIPVIMFNELADMRRQMRDPNAHAGGRGGMFGISMCCREHQKEYSKNPAVRRVQMKAETHQVLLHETIHNLQQHRCYYVRKDQKNLPPAKNPGAWYVEGIAEVGMLQVTPQARAAKFREFFQKAGKGVPSFGSVGYGDGSVYLYGAIMLQYVMDTRGAGAIREFYDDMCRGVSESESAERHLASAPVDLLTKAAEYYQAHKTTVVANMERWELEGRERLGYQDPDTVIRKLPQIRTSTDIREIPDIWNARRMNTAAFQGIYEGAFVGPAGEKVYLWKNGTHSVTWEEGKATYFGTDSASLESNGQALTQWKDGTRKWTCPDKSSALLRGGRIEYFDAQGKSIPRPEQK